MYRKFNTARASLVRMRNKSRSPLRFISARRASFVRGAPAPLTTAASHFRSRAETYEGDRPPATNPPIETKVTKRLWQTSRYYIVVVVVVVVVSPPSPAPYTLPSPTNPRRLHTRTHMLNILYYYTRTLVHYTMHII